MILSKVMRETDYPKLNKESQTINKMRSAGVAWFAPQHWHRMWEYSMALKALRTVFVDRNELLVSDVGCACSFLSPLLIWLGHNVRMYEVWQHEFVIAGINMRSFTIEQAEVARNARPDGEKGSYVLINKGMESLDPEDGELDAAFSISTLEHITDWRTAFTKFLGTVKPGGLAFMTCDYGDHAEDDYEHAGLRAGQMFTQEAMKEMQGIGETMGFSLVGGTSDWDWSDDCRLVSDYGFASIALQREKE